MAFSCPFVFLTEASKITCILRGALPGFAFLTCYAPLFLKTNRIYRIFFSARVSVTRPSLVSSQSQFAALFGVLAVQIIVSVVWFISQVPLPVANVSTDYSYVTIRCSSDSNPILLILNLSLSVLFMICCTVLAFKTRHFPKNYNEAKHIGITLYITCVVWSLFLPIFFLSRTVDYDFLREYLMCIVCILIGFVIPDVHRLYLDWLRHPLWHLWSEDIDDLPDATTWIEPRKTSHMLCDQLQRQRERQRTGKHSFHNLILNLDRQGMEC